MPSIVPVGDAAVLVRFGDTLSEAANRQAIAFAAGLDADVPEGVEEIAPGLVSVLLRTKPNVDFWRASSGYVSTSRRWRQPVRPGRFLSFSTAKT